MTNWLDDQLFSNRTIAANGVALPARPTLNIIGATVEDDAANGRTVLTITGGGGGGGAQSVALVDLTSGDHTLTTEELACPWLIVYVSSPPGAQRKLIFPSEPASVGYVIVNTGVGEPLSAWQASVLVASPSDTGGQEVTRGAAALATYVAGNGFAVVQLASNAAEADPLVFGATSLLSGTATSYLPAGGAVVEALAAPAPTMTRYRALSRWKVRGPSTDQIMDYVLTAAGADVATWSVAAGAGSASGTFAPLAVSDVDLVSLRGTPRASMSPPTGSIVVALS